MRLLISALVVLVGCAAQEDPRTPGALSVPPLRSDTLRPDWGATFEAFGARGAFVAMETEGPFIHRYNPERAAERFTPASTSKLYNALVFLDRSVISDVDSMHAWDGVERSIRSWNRDHSLRTAMENSALWLFQRTALQVGREGYDEVFEIQPYGNSTMGEPLEMSWLDGSWRISPDEQLAFVDALRTGSLAFSPEAQATVRAITPELASGDGWRVLAKTGWALREGEPDLGWLVGWVERASGDVAFVLNVEAAAPDSEWTMGPDRLRLAMALLEQSGWLTP